MNLTPRPSPPKPSKVQTEVISLAELKIPEEALIDAIKLTWNAVDPNLENRASIAFHKPSKLLIISGPQEAIENAQKTVGALLPSYRELIQPKAKTQAMIYPMKDMNPAQLKLAVPRVVPATPRPNGYSGSNMKEAPKSYRRPTTPEQVPASPKPRDSDLFEEPSNSVRRLDLQVVPKPIPLPRR